MGTDWIPPAGFIREMRGGLDLDGDRRRPPRQRMKTMIGAYGAWAATLVPDGPGSHSLQGCPAGEFEKPLASAISCAFFIKIERSTATTVAAPARAAKIERIPVPQPKSSTEFPGLTTSSIAL